MKGISYFIKNIFYLCLDNNEDLYFKLFNKNEKATFNIIK